MNSIARLNPPSEPSRLAATLGGGIGNGLRKSGGARRESRSAGGLMMQATINGQVEAFDGELSVATLLETKHLAPVRVAVELNEDVVPRRAFAATWIRDGDRVEIVTFVGGG